jgi:hypothetical protein
MDQIMETRPYTLIKLLFYAGEHHAVSQFGLAGKYAVKISDCIERYDLAVVTGTSLIRVIIKTRSEAMGMINSGCFRWDKRIACDWFVFVFKTASGPLRSWVIPADLAEQHANKPGSKSKYPWFRELTWKMLNQPLLACYEDNWGLQPDFSDAVSMEATNPDLSSLLVRESD